MFHPSGLLDALVRAQTSATSVDGRSVELGLDYHVLDAAADVGLAPDWRSTAVEQLTSSGRISHVTLFHRSIEDPDSLIRLWCVVSEPVEVARIDLPPAELTISLAAKIEQDYNDGRRTAPRDP